MSRFRSWIIYVYRFFGKLKFRYKLLLYFMAFGIFIGYFSFLLYTWLVTRQGILIMSGVVEEWLADDRSGNDSILEYIDRPYKKQENNFPVFRFILSDLSKNPGVSDIAIYYFNSQKSVWCRLAKDREGYIRKSSTVDKKHFSELESAADNRVSYSKSFLPGKRGTLCFRVNLTRPGDKNIYIVEILADRLGFLRHMGGYYILPVYALCLFVLSLFVSRLIALHISRPIQKLSFQAMQIASGGLDVRTEILSRDELGDLSSVINTMADEIRDYLEDINERMDAITVMNHIDKAVLASTSRKDLLARVTSFVSGFFTSSYIAIGIADNEEKMYHVLSSSGKDETGEAKKLSISFDRLGLKLLRKNREFYILDYASDSEEIEDINRVVDICFAHLINLPVYIDDEYMGSFVAGKTEDVPFTKFEVETLAALADQVGVALKSVRHVEEKENLYLGIIMALSKAIDAKSQWTAGHSERVAGYSVKIAEKLGLPEEQVRDIQISAILHDVGKIGVPESLLDKPGRLTPDEYRLVKEHPYQGALIVSEIPGSRNVMNGVLTHHESWDGSGYPFGVEGDDIPIAGRIIAVADVYDAIVADRPYRKGMSIQDAVDFLISQKGGLFEPHLVDIMVEIIAAGEI